MENQLTINYTFIKSINPMAAEVYKDRQHYLTNNEIAEYRKLKISEVKELYSLAKRILKDPERAWMTGLSNHAKNTLINNGKTNMKDLINQVVKEGFDLESLNGLGHQAAVEIRKWCLKHS